MKRLVMFLLLIFAVGCTQKTPDTTPTSDAVAADAPVNDAGVSQTSDAAEARTDALTKAD